MYDKPIRVYTRYICRRMLKFIFFFFSFIDRIFLWLSSFVILCTPIAYTNTYFRHVGIGRTGRKEHGFQTNIWTERDKPLFNRSVIMRVRHDRRFYPRQFHICVFSSRFFKFQRNRRKARVEETFYRLVFLDLKSVTYQYYLYVSF